MKKRSKQNEEKEGEEQKQRKITCTETIKVSNKA